MNTSNPLEHLAATIDGYARARTAADRRLYLRATLRGLATLTGALHTTLLALVTAVTKDPR